MWAYQATVTSATVPQCPLITLQSKIFLSSFVKLICKTLIYLFILEAEQKRGKGKERQIFLELVQSLNFCKDWDQARTKPGASNSIRVSHMRDRGPDTWTIFHCYCRPIRKELYWKWSNQDFSWHSRGCWCCKLWLTMLCCNAACFLLFLNHHK